jgi:hypothetical protein
VVVTIQIFFAKSRIGENGRPLMAVRIA